jgi:hypothetical protein
VDLIVPRGGSPPSLHGLLHEPSEVACVVEVKLSGLVDAKKTLPALRRSFNLAEEAGVKRCCYVCFVDRRKASTVEEELGFPCFKLCDVSGRWPKAKYRDTGDWPRLLDFLRSPA